MKQAFALDCTLRDGGYCNEWRFGFSNIKKIVSHLITARVEVIECGFLTNKVVYDKDVSIFTDVSQLVEVIPKHNDSSKFVLMVNFGEYDFTHLPPKKDSVIDGIRLAFHKTNRLEVMDACRCIKDKGYDLYIQPMVSMLYSTDEFEEMICMLSKFSPKALYIVDSFGMMHKEDVLRYFRILERLLPSNVIIGFHSHNNLQLAYSNAIILLECNGEHSLVIDCSIYGMGRGAGNLNSELFLSELNAYYGKKYEIKPLLTIMDEVISRFYEESPWGYSLPNYLSAKHMIHPNYANYLNSKRTLTVENIDEIFSMIGSEEGSEYNEDFISDLYVKYMSTGVSRNEHLFEIKKESENRTVLLIAPGKSAIDEKNLVENFVKENNPIVISINHEYPIIASDYIFVSNIRRFKNIERKLYCKTISTSNIKSLETYASVDYFKLLNPIDCVRDNAGLMAIRFVLEELNAKEVFIAGMDGYSPYIYSNFETREMAFVTSADRLNEMNVGLKKAIDLFSEMIDIHFITTSLLDK